jgi:hypothetical protein
MMKLQNLPNIYWKQTTHMDQWKKQMEILPIIIIIIIIYLTAIGL